MPLSLQMKRQPRFLHRGERDSPFRFLAVVEHDEHVVLPDFLDLRLEPAAVLRRQDAGPTTHEPTPITRRPQWAFPRRRHLQLVVRRNERVAVEQCFDRPRPRDAIIDGHLARVSNRWFGKFIKFVGRFEWRDQRQSR